MYARTAILLAFLCLAANTHARFIFGLNSAGNRLVKIESSAPGTIVRSVALTGLADGEQMVGIDFVPGNGNDIAPGLYGLSSSAKIYIINTLTGTATNGIQIATGNNCPSSFDASTSVGFDNNPTNAGLRITTAAGGNFAVSGYANTGACATQTSYAGATTGAAYTNPFFQTSATTLYAFNGVTNTIGTVTPASNGAAFAPLANAIGLTLSSPFVSFDIFYDTSASANVLMGVFTVDGVSSLYRIDLTTGLPTVVGRFGSGALIRSIAISLSDNSVETPFVGLTVSSRRIFRFNIEDPSSVENVQTLSGFQNDIESLVGITFQPLASSGYPLFGISSISGQSGNLYRVDANSGVLTLVGAACNLQGNQFSVDFNPINNAGAIRVISDTDNNYRVIAANGTCFTDGSIPSAFTINAAAYTNSVSGASATTLRAIDGSTQAAAIGQIDPPNSGTFTTTAALFNGYPTVTNTSLPPARGAFDIITVNSADIGYVALGSTNNGLVGRLDPFTGNFLSISIAAVAIDSMSAYLAAPPAVLPTFDFLVQNQNTITIYRTDSTTATFTGDVTGLLDGATIIGISLRPSNGQVYALTNNGQLYTINLSPTGTYLEATLSSSITGCDLTNGVDYVIDFNPVADLLRILGDDRTNLRVNVETGACTVDGTVKYIDGTPSSPVPAGVAYTNNVAGATATAEYMLDEEGEFFSRVNVPNAGNSSVIASIPAIAGVTPLDFILLDGAEYGFYLSGSTLVAIDINGEQSTVGTYTSGTGLVVVTSNNIFPIPPAAATTTTSGDATATTDTATTTAAATSASASSTTGRTTASGSNTGTSTTTSAASSIAAACFVIPAVVAVVLSLLW